MKIVYGVILLAMALFVIEYANRKPSPVYCDFTKLAYQSPEFIERYFSGRQHTTSMDKVNINGVTRSVQRYEYMGDNNGLPYTGIEFYKGKAIELTVFFFQSQPPIETARRVGLNLSTFQFKSTNGWSTNLTGTYKGIRYANLMLTNIKNIDPGSRNVSAQLVVPDASRN